MTRRKAITALAAMPGALAAAPAEPCVINIAVDEGPTVTVTVPNIRKEDIIEILSTFFAAGPDGNNDKAIRQNAYTKMVAAMSKARTVKLVLRSDC